MTVSDLGRGDNVFRGGRRFVIFVHEQVKSLHYEVLHGCLLDVSNSAYHNGELKSQSHLVVIEVIVDGGLETLTDSFGGDGVDVARSKNRINHFCERSALLFRDCMKRPVSDAIQPPHILVPLTRHVERWQPV